MPCVIRRVCDGGCHIEVGIIPLADRGTIGNSWRWNVYGGKQERFHIFIAGATGSFEGHYGGSRLVVCKVIHQYSYIVAEMVTLYANLVGTKILS